MSEGGQSVKAYSFLNIQVVENNDFVIRDVHFTKDLFIPDHYLARCRVRKLNAEPFILSPGKVFIDIEHPLGNQSLRDHFVRQYVHKGATLLITQFQIRRQLTWKSEFQRYVTSLKGLAIDYMVAPKIDIKYLSNDMIRYFGLQKVPFIIVELTDAKDVSKLKFGWIKQMQVMTKIPLAVMENKNGKLLYQMFKQNDILICDQRITKKPLRRDVLIQTGISPKKGEIRIYGDSDFNLYLQKDIFKNHLSLQSLLEGEANPYISVIRGKVIKLNKTILDQRGFGEQNQISIQNHF